MPSRTIKVAISMPKSRFKALEGIRQGLNLSRSALIDEAIRYWLESKRRQQLIDRYVKGYIEKPEDANALKGLESAQFASFNKEKW